MALGVEIEGAFDTNQHIVGRAQAHGAAPDDATALGLDNPAHAREIQIDGCEHFHGVRGPGR